MLMFSIALWLVSLWNGCIFCCEQTVWLSNGLRIPDSGRFAKTCCLSCSILSEDLEPAFSCRVSSVHILVSDNNKTLSHMSELLKKDKCIMLLTSQSYYRPTNISDTSHKQLWRREIILNINQLINQSIIILSEQMQKHCSHCTSIWGDITCREMTVKKGKF